MIRFLQWFNLGGVCVLVVLCAVQWQLNRSLNLRAIDLEKQEARDTKALVEKDKTIEGNIADMNDFRERLSKTDGALKQAQGTISADDAKITELSAQCQQLTSSIDTLKASLEEWKQAVATRDEALKKSQEQAAKLAADRNDTIIKFNDLATHYNTAQEQLKQAADQLKKLADDRNDVVAKFNDLANKYNALVKETGPATTRP
jgi:chromosome segregation ATPase